MAFLATQGIDAIKAPADLDAAIARQEVDVALRIGVGLRRATGAMAGRRWWKSSRTAPVATARSRVRACARRSARYRDQVGALRLLARGIDPSITRALNVGSRDLATEDAKRGLMLSAIMPYLLILMSFLGGAYLIMDATAGERERQSLEPLLATPAARGAIVSGKIAAACALGLLSLLLTLLAFKLSAQIGSGVGKMLDVRFAAIGKMLLVLLPMLFIGTTLLTYLSAAAKSMKEAQSHMTWLMLLPMIPTIALAVNPIKTQLVAVHGAVPGAEPDAAESDPRRGDRCAGLGDLPGRGFRRRGAAVVCGGAALSAGAAGDFRLSLCRSQLAGDGGRGFSPDGVPAKASGLKPLPQGRQQAGSCTSAEKKPGLRRAFFCLPCDCDAGSPTGRAACGAISSAD